MKGFFHNLIVALALAIFIFFFHSQPSKSDTLKFVQLSDVHYSTVRKDTSYKLLSKSKPLLLDAVAQINKMNGVDFVMETGDCIDQPTESSAKEAFAILNTLKYPWYYAIGNHDTTLRGYFNKTRLVSLLNQENPSYTFSKLYYSFVPKKGFKVIVLDGAKDEEMTANGYICEDELKWLDCELNDSKRDVVLIFLHFPLLEPFPSAHHKIVNSDEFYQVLNKYKNPIAIFTGHYHTTKITKVNNFLHVSTPSLVSYPNSFRTISVTSCRDKAIFDFKFNETRLKDVQTKAKLMTFGSSSYYGKDSDRTTTVVIDK